MTACPVGFFQSFIFRGMGSACGGSWSHGMLLRELQAGASLLSAFAAMIGGAVGVGLPMALIIIWVCS